MLKKSIKAVKKQSAFCLELMERLDGKIREAELCRGCIKYHTRRENEVVRLRQELLELADMLKQWGYEE